MAQKTLAIDVQIANAYLGLEIGVLLQEAAKQALEVYNIKTKEEIKKRVISALITTCIKEAYI